jgi:hypothetical protein
MPKVPSRPALDLSGKWVVELPSMPPDYLAGGPDPHVLIRHEDFYRFSATYQFGTHKGEIDGRVDDAWPNAAQLFLTFMGTDAGEPVFGAVGDGAYNGGNEETISGTLRYHLGEDLPFELKREKAGKAKAEKGKTSKAKNVKGAAKALAEPVVGRWHIVSMPDWDEDTINEEVQAFIKIEKSGKGVFHFAFVRGDMVCRFTSRDGQPAVEWSWEGHEEVDPVNGTGWAVLKEDDLHGVIAFADQDEAEFVAKKANRSGK